ncbi:FecR domain-containing protein [Chitinophaga sp. MM2321]|uniref:FecR family protein n=1 Tax=Chitinophaga sp. MM2321 TaxID=3137178 RepID=UPI0032D58716
MEQTDLHLLLKKYKAGECSAEEVVLLFAWLDRMAADPSEHALPPAAKESVHKALVKHIQPATTGRWRYRHLWMAAATLLPVVVSFFWWQQSTQRIQTPAIAWIKYSTGKEEIKNIQLPDGSTAWLNAASTLEYPQQFAGKERLVKISGQAFFTIQQNKEQPFTVQTGTLRVNVLGTAFLVKNVPGQPAKVAVASGKVQVTHQNKVLATLLPADQLTYTDQKTTISKTDTTTINAWTKGDLLISNATLQQVLWELETFYDVRFHSKINLEQGNLNLSFSNGMSLQDKLDIIATISMTPKIQFKKTARNTYEVE